VNVTIAGAGVIGCAIAHELAARGARVRVLDSRVPGGGATRASAGILAPYIEGHDQTLLSLGLRSQSDRYRALGDHVAASEREPQALTVRFDDEVDLDLLLETVEVERGCCTFFDLAPDVRRRELVVSVADRERVPALDAIATAMGVS